MLQSLKPPLTLVFHGQSRASMKKERAYYFFLKSSMKRVTSSRFTEASNVKVINLASSLPRFSICLDLPISLPFAFRALASNSPSTESRVMRYTSTLACSDLELVILIPFSTTELPRVTLFSSSIQAKREKMKSTDKILRGFIL